MKRRESSRIDERDRERERISKNGREREIKTRERRKRKRARERKRKREAREGSRDARGEHGTLDRTLLPFPALSIHRSIMRSGTRRVHRTTSRRNKGCYRFCDAAYQFFPSLLPSLLSTFLPFIWKDNRCCEIQEIEYRYLQHWRIQCVQITRKKR